MKFEYGDKVTVVKMSDCEILGKVGTIRGIYGEFPDIIRDGVPIDTNFYIVQFDDILENGFDSIVLTAVCLEYCV